MKQPPVYVLNHSQHNFRQRSTQADLEVIEDWTDRAARRMARVERRLGRKTERDFKRIQRRQDREQTGKAAARVVWPERRGGRR